MDSIGSVPMETVGDSIGFVPMETMGDSIGSVPMETIVDSIGSVPMETIVDSIGSVPMDLWDLGLREAIERRDFGDKNSIWGRPTGVCPPLDERKKGLNEAYSYSPCLPVCV